MTDVHSHCPRSVEFYFSSSVPRHGDEWDEVDAVAAIIRQSHELPCNNPPTARAFYFIMERTEFLDRAEDRLRLYRFLYNLGLNDETYLGLNRAEATPPVVFTSMSTVRIHAKLLLTRKRHGDL